MYTLNLISVVERICYLLCCMFAVLYVFCVYFLLWSLSSALVKTVCFMLKLTYLKLELLSGAPHRRTHLVCFCLIACIITL